MSLQKKIQKIIDVIKDSNIEEIEVSSFWGIQKIKLSKSKLKEQTPVIIKEPIPSENLKETLHENSKNTIVEDDSTNEDNVAALDPVGLDTEETTTEIDENLDYQKAPLVGTFYLSSKPGEPPFVSVGDTVSKGQTLCIIEAMKIFNEIESDFDGEVVEVLVDDQSPVEFNQEIFSIRPN